MSYNDYDYDYPHSDDSLHIPASDYYDLDLDPGTGADRLQFTATERLMGCLWPSTQQFGHLVATYVLNNVAYGALVHGLLSPVYGIWLPHCLSALFGVIILQYTYGTDGASKVIGFCLANLFAYKVLAAIRRPRNRPPFRIGPAAATISCGLLLLGELADGGSRQWHAIRGSLLVVTMKAVSVGFDYDAAALGRTTTTTAAAERRPPRLLALAGYLVAPGNCVFGPWVAFGDYMGQTVAVGAGAAGATERSMRKRMNRYIRLVSANLVASYACLIASNCLIATIFPATSRSLVLSAIRDAMSFRFSHYFVSYLGQALLLSSGCGQSVLDGQLGGSRWFGMRTVEPWSIELPRSLVRVVIVWNRAMHVWLKQYVFRPLRPRGPAVAIFGTYAVSALLHGLNFQLAAVLLSLGLFTYIEHSVRSRLAAIFSACILATACKPAPHNCGHRHRSRAAAVVAFNAAASLLTCWNLAYLGMMFATSVDVEYAEAELGYSYWHTLERWAALKFSSHWLMVVAWFCLRMV